MIPAVVLNQQSLSTAAPTTTLQFSHHLALLTSRSDSQRRDSLSHLTSAIAGRPKDAPLPQPIAVIFPKLLPLTLDGSNGVRAQLLKLLRSLPPDDTKDQMEKLSLYIRAGLTHLAADIRTSTIELLEWALEIGGEELVSCPGGWVKTLKTLLTALAWTDDVTLAGWTSSRAIIGRAGSGDKSLAKALTVLALFLRAGLEPPPAADIRSKPNFFPLWHVDAHMIPKKSNPYGYLNLFGPPRDEESQGYEDREERQIVFAKIFQDRVGKGAAAARKEGGEIGRAGAAVVKALEEGMKDAQSNI